MTSDKKRKVGFFTKPIDQETSGIGSYLKQLIKNTKRKFKKIKNILTTLRKKKHTDFSCPIIHQKFWVEDINRDMHKNNIFHQKFKKPDNLAIVTAHNYKTKSIFEKSLDHLGIKDYVCLNHPEITEWNHIYKPTWLLKYLKSGKCKEDLILFCDSADCILINDPKKIVDLFFKFKCELLFMSTNMAEGYPTKECRIWAKNFNGTSYRHLNSGVYVGKKNFIIKFLEEFMCIIKDIQLRKHPIWKSLRDYYREKNINAYSIKSSRVKLIISEQNIFRYMHPKYPQIKIDINNSLACRNYKHFWGYFGKILKFLY